MGVLSWTLHFLTHIWHGSARSLTWDKCSVCYSGVWGSPATPGPGSSKIMSRDAESILSLNSWASFPFFSSVLGCWRGLSKATWGGGDELVQEGEGAQEGKSRSGDGEHRAGKRQAAIVSPSQGWTEILLKNHHSLVCHIRDELQIRG